MTGKTKAAMPGRQCNTALQKHRQITRLAAGGQTLSRRNPYAQINRVRLTYGDRDKGEQYSGSWQNNVKRGLEAPTKNVESCEDNQPSLRGEPLHNSLRVAQNRPFLRGAVHSITGSNPVQPFGSMPRLSSSRRKRRFIHPDLLSSPSSFIAKASRSDSSLSSLSCTTWRSLFSLVDIVNSCGLVCSGVDNVLHCMTCSKAKPRSARTLTGPLTTNVNACNEAAMLNHTPTRFKFLFLAVCRSDLNAKPHRESVTAHSEQDARRSLAGQFVLSFAGRLPEVSHGA